MQVKNLQAQKGFTLVEIAIVLVIIGLLLGGVLKGQELIQNSKVKSVTQDLEGTSAAYYAYKDRTGKVPGDTDDDGIINSNSQFWFDLRTEGFVKGTLGTAATSASPVHALDGVITAHGGASGAMFTKNFICADKVPEKYGSTIDIKTDDGNGATGSVRGAAGATLPTAGAAWDTASEDDSFVCKEF